MPLPPRSLFYSILTGLARPSNLWAPPRLGQPQSRKRRPGSLPPGHPGLPPPSVVGISRSAPRPSARTCAVRARAACCPSPTPCGHAHATSPPPTSPSPHPPPCLPSPLQPPPPPHTHTRTHTPLNRPETHPPDSCRLRSPHDQAPAISHQPSTRRLPRILSVRIAPIEDASSWAARAMDGYPERRRTGRGSLAAPGTAPPNGAACALVAAHVRRARGEAAEGGE